MCRLTPIFVTFLSVRCMLVVYLFGENLNSHWALVSSRWRIWICWWVLPGF